MKRLTTYSILTSSDDKEEQHMKEVEAIFSKIYGLVNYLCVYDISYIDKYHSKIIKPKSEYNELHNFEEILEKTDFKNGIDIFLDDEDTLVFIVYGQGYKYQYEYSLVTTKITVSTIGKFEAFAEFLKI